MSVRQCVILVGGAGTRLGKLTHNTPKPMLPVAGRPFLEHLIEKAAGHGFNHILLLAGHQAHIAQDWVSRAQIDQKYSVEISWSVEDTPLGTGGALVHARNHLDEAFLLVNGDTWFDFDWRALADDDAFSVMLALREVAVADRYETVDLEGNFVRRFIPRGGVTQAGLINGGVYRLNRNVVPDEIQVMSLEQNLLTNLARDQKLGGRIFSGAFIDIGVPESYAAAQDLLAR